MASFGASSIPSQRMRSGTRESGGMTLSASSVSERKSKSRSDRETRSASASAIEAEIRKPEKTRSMEVAAW